MKNKSVSLELLESTGNEEINKILTIFRKNYSKIVDDLIKDGRISCRDINDLYGNLDPELQSYIIKVRDYINKFIQLKILLNECRNIDNVLKLLDEDDYKDITINQEICELVLSKCKNSDDKKKVFTDPRFAKFRKTIELVEAKQKLRDFLISSLKECKITGKGGINGVIQEIHRRLKEVQIKEKFDREIILEIYFELTSGEDVFEANTPSKPKEAIANHLAEMGVDISSPDRYNLKQIASAIESGETIVIRSEHKEEYNGPSGLFESFELDSKVMNICRDFIRRQRLKNIEDIIPTYIGGFFSVNDLSLTRCSFYQLFYTLFIDGEISEEELNKYLVNLTKYTPNFRDYSEANNFSQEEQDNLLKGLNFSYWKYEPGFNRTIVADSAIPNRYHIITTLGKYNQYLVIENGKIMYEYCSLKSDIGLIFSTKLNNLNKTLIEAYEKVRNTKGFNPNHCPIMEFQTVINRIVYELGDNIDNYISGNHKYLQYHRTINENLADFVLERDLEDGEIEAIFVRGKTPRLGIEIEINSRRKPLLIQEYTGGNVINATSYGNFSCECFIRKLEYLISTSSTTFPLAELGEHGIKSTIFKPGFFCKTMGINFISNSEIPVPVPEKVKLRIESDGRRCFIKCLTPGVKIIPLRSKGSMQ